jgi:hypothetical protein
MLILHMLYRLSCIDTNDITAVFVYSCSMED